MRVPVLLAAAVGVVVGAVSTAVVQAQPEPPRLVYEELPPIEPFACGRVAGRNPDPGAIATSISCVTGWIQLSKGYLKAGGQPTGQTNAEEFAKYKGWLQQDLAALGEWLKQTKFDGEPTDFERSDVGKAVAEAGAKLPKQTK